MVKSPATTVEDYLAALPENRREVVTAVRAAILRSLPEGYREGVNWGMIAYEVPLERYPDTYNKQPLNSACLAAQKNHFALYLNCIDAGSDRGKRLRSEFAKAGKTLDMGKSCIRFKSLDVIGRVIAEMSVDECIVRYESSRHKA